MSYINIYNCLLIWNHNMLYYKYNKHTQLLEKRIKWENITSAYSSEKTS